MSDFPAVAWHGPLSPVVPGVYCVRGTFRVGPGMRIGRTMTVLEAPDGLVLLNAIRLSEEALADLQRLGRIKHLVRLSDSHGYDEPFYAARYSPKVWTLPGAKLGRLASSGNFGDDGPVPGGVVVDFGSLAGWRESAYRVPAGGGTLVSCDAVQNWVDAEGTSPLGRLAVSLMGFKGGVIVPRVWRKYQKVAGVKVRETFDRIGRLEFENLVSGHGPALVGGAGTAVRAAIGEAAEG